MSNVGRVAARNSGQTVATVQDLFVALCEDAAVYTMFKTMKGGSRAFREQRHADAAYSV